MAFTSKFDMVSRKKSTIKLTFSRPKKEPGSVSREPLLSVSHYMLLTVVWWGCIDVWSAILYILYCNCTCRQIEERLLEMFALSLSKSVIIDIFKWLKYCTCLTTVPVTVCVY